VLTNNNVRVKILISVRGGGVVVCCSGRCKYEGYMGDCTVRGKYPDDALCIVIEKEIEEEENHMRENHGDTN
jgi:hypothetical protein